MIYFVFIYEGVYLKQRLKSAAVIYVWIYIC